MGGLLDVANVQRGDGNWSSGYQIDSIGCALRSEVTDVCSPVRSRISGDAEGDGTTEGLNANIFAVVTSLKGRAMCSSGDEEGIVAGALDMETEKAAGLALWGNTGNTEVSLASAAVSSVAAGPNANATVSALLKEFWDLATGVRYQDTIIHLGIGRLMEMFGEIEGSVLKNLGIQVATSPGYPSDGIAITGPVTIKIGSDQVLRQNDSAVNTVLTEANRLVALEFDPCIAVRVP